MGVWIETKGHDDVIADISVTPCVGVWIETSKAAISKAYLGSHPAWVCGLKQVLLMISCCAMCHTLRGCVD